MGGGRAGGNSKSVGAGAGSAVCLDKESWRGELMLDGSCCSGAGASAGSSGGCSPGSLAGRSAGPSAGCSAGRSAGSSAGFLAGCSASVGTLAAAAPPLGVIMISVEVESSLHGAMQHTWCGPSVARRTAFYVAKTVHESYQHSDRILRTRARC